MQVGNVHPYTDPRAGAREKELGRRRRYRGSSSGVDSASSDAWSDTASEDLHCRSLDRLGDGRSRFSDSSGVRCARIDHPIAERTRSLGRDAPDGGVNVVQASVVGRSTDNVAYESTMDAGTYEQVLFINGRPQYQDDMRR